MLTRARILGLFEELNDELQRHGTRGDVFLVGGAAMLLAYAARPSTRDVDAIWQPSALVRSAAAEVAARHDDLEPDWLNDGVKGFLPGEDLGVRRVVYENNFLTVSVASPEYLLATKLLASRVGRDEQDIRYLLGVCGLGTVDEGVALVTRFYGPRPIEAKVRFLLEEILADRPPGQGAAESPEP